jgi:hypothetical protein
MLNPFTEVNWNPDIRARKKFADSLIFGFPAIATVLSLVMFLFKHSWKPAFLWLGIIGLMVGIILRLVPQIAKPIYRVWYFLACCMGFVVGNVLFSLVFYLVFTPLGLCLRMRGNKPLTRGFDRSRKSYWTDAEKPVEVKNYYRQF